MQLPVRFSAPQMQARVADHHTSVIRKTFREIDFLVFARPNPLFQRREVRCSPPAWPLILVAWFPDLWELGVCRGQDLATPALSLPMWRPTAAPAPDRGGEGGRWGHASAAGLHACGALRRSVVRFSKVTVKAPGARQRGAERRSQACRGPLETSVLSTCAATPSTECPETAGPELSLQDQQSPGPTQVSRTSPASGPGHVHECRWSRGPRAQPALSMPR